MDGVQAESWGSEAFVGAVVVFACCKASGNYSRGKMMAPNTVMTELHGTLG